MKIKYHPIFDKNCHIADDLNIDQVFNVCEKYGINPFLHIEEFKKHPEFKHLTNDEIKGLWETYRHV